MGLVELISERTNEELKSVPYLRSIPCKVLEVISGESVRVECVANGAKYTIPNYSANAVNSGDSCIVYYTNNTPIGVTGYIGATQNAPIESSPVNKIEGEVSSVVANSSYKEVSAIGVKCKNITVVTLFVNLNIYGNAEGEFQLKVSINGIDEVFEPKQSVQLNGYSSISYSTSFTMQSGNSEIIISCKGTGSVVNGNVIACGHGIERYERFEPTTKDDYLYISSSDNIYTRGYIGNKTNISIPTEIDGIPVKTIGAATFNYSDVTSVYIPDGVTEIE